MKRKIFTLLFSLLLHTVLLAQYGGGNGSQRSPYKIKKPTHLVTLSKTMKHWQGKYFELTADIDMAKRFITPIGNSTTAFNGQFEGNKYSIKNLTVKGKETNKGTGLFGVLNGSVANLGLVNFNFSGNGYSRVGAIAGVLDNGSIRRCYSLGGSIDVGNGGWTGGIVGVMFSGGDKTVEDCFSSINIKAGWASGGIVGINRGAHKINRVAFYGSIQGGKAIVTIQNDPNNTAKKGIPPTNAFYLVKDRSTDYYGKAIEKRKSKWKVSYKNFDFAETWNISHTLGFATLQTSNQDSDPIDPQSEDAPDPLFFTRIETEKVESSNIVDWKPFGPGMAGYCEEFWCHPTDPNVMFMGPDMHVSFGSWDNGKSWQTIKDSDGDGQDMKRVLDIEFSRSNANFGLAIDWNGIVFKTTDKGHSWKAIKDLGLRHSELAIDPTNDSIWYVGAGDFWNIKENHKSKNEPNGMFFTHADYGHIWKSTDKGQNWKKFNTGLPNSTDVIKIIVNPLKTTNLIMATNHGLYHSFDGGKSWKKKAKGLPNNLPRDLTSFHSGRNFTMFLVEQTVYIDKGNTVDSRGGIYKSTDGGLKWTNITGDLAINLDSIKSYWPRSRYQTTIANWFDISKAAVKSKYTVYPKKALSVFNRIVVNPKNPQEIYISHNKKINRAFGPGDVWKTNDGGKHWIACARNGQYWIKPTANEKSYWEKRKNPSGANMTFAHLQSYMDKDTERSGTRMLEINARGEVIIGVNQQTLRSQDNGASWHQIDDFETSPGSKKWVGRGGSNLPGRFLLLETGIRNRKLLCSGEHGLWQTTNLGRYRNKSAVAVEQLEGQVNEHGAHSVSTVAVHPKNPDIIYIFAWRQEHRGKLRRSMDGGRTWENISTVFESDNNEWESIGIQYSLQIDPVNPKRMYFCSIRNPISEVGGKNRPRLTKGDFGFYRSDDGGYNWKLYNNGLPSDASVRRIAMFPGKSNILYAALNNSKGGLYKTDNGGDKWEKVPSLPKEINAVNNIFIDRNTKHFFISCGRRAGDIKEGGVWKSKDLGKTWEKIFRAPFVWQAETSPVNPNIIVISAAGQAVTYIDKFRNPGVYLSKNAGLSWTKINKGLGQPDKIVDVKPDPYEENVLWCASWGCGWYKGIIQSDKKTISINSKEDVEPTKNNNVKEGVNITVYPNPARDILTISSKQIDLSKAKFRISSLTGSVTKIIKPINIDKQRIQIPVSELKQGIYIIKIATEGNTYTHQFLKQ